MSPSDARPRVALLLTGQGAQYRNMASRLYQTLPRFRSHVDECAAQLDRYLTRPLLSCIYYSPEQDPDLLAQTALTQPAMFTIDYALARLLMDFGVKPAFLLGHSIGEYVAACLAGVMSLSDATRLVAARGRLIQALPAGGGMAAVFAASDRLTPLLEPFVGRLWFAANNRNHQVVSGELAALTALFKALDSAGITYRRLRVSHAFHTPLLLPMVAEYRQALERAKFSKPGIPIISNVSGESSHPASFDADHWVEHLLAPVKFEQGIRSALVAGVNVFVECGPDKNLASLAKAIVSDRASVFTTLDRKQEDWTGLLECLGGLYQRGLAIDWACFDADFARTRVAMPTYPFSPKTYRPSTTPMATDDKAEPSSVEPCAHASTPPVTSHPIALVQQTVADYLMVPSSGIDPTQNFHDLGLDSQGAVEITTRLGRIIDKTLQPTLLFEYQTPVALAEYLEREHGADLTVHDPIATPPPLAPRSVPAIEAQESAEVQVREQDIAIIGMACRLPGADDLSAYWQLLRNGKSAITEVDPSRWSVEDYFDPDHNVLHASYSKWGAFLNRPHEFDPLFFGVSPREAAAMDPQQRLFMAVAWEALQQSGYGGAFHTREIGVYVGCEQNHYGEHFTNYQRYEVLRRRLMDSRWFQRLSPSERVELVETLQKVLRPAEMVADAVAGNGLNVIPARISHWLDLRGPSLMVNTACSSALVALHLACESLRLGESRMAIVGGVYLAGNDSPFVFLSRVGALSPSGVCLPFDRRANGMVLGEGVSALVLKPLREAMVDGDFIHAVIKGSAINNDGHSTGITAPNPRGQADAIRKAYRNAGVSPETVSYIECHGTGTPLGDPVEAQGLKLAFETFTDREHFCAVGSVKSSIGHMLSAAGIPSVIKVALAMQHGLIPPTAGFVDPNPYLDFATSPFYLQGDRAIEWQSGQRPRLAGVNAFGFGGTNCHVVLEEAPRLPARAVPELAASPTLLLLTGRTPAVLQRVAQALGDYLAEHPAIQPGEVGLTVNGSQRDLNHKAALIIDDRRHLIEVLGAIARGRGSPDVLHGKANPKISTPVYLAFDSDNPMDLPAIEDMIARFPGARADPRRVPTVL